MHQQPMYIKFISITELVVVIQMVILESNLVCVPYVSVFQIRANLDGSLCLCQSRYKHGLEKTSFQSLTAQWM